MSNVQNPYDIPLCWLVNRDSFHGPVIIPIQLGVVSGIIPYYLLYIPYINQFFCKFSRSTSPAVAAGAKGFGHCPNEIAQLYCQGVVDQTAESNVTDAQTQKPKLIRVHNMAMPCHDNQNTTVQWRIAVPQIQWCSARRSLHKDIYFAQHGLQTAPECNSLATHRNFLKWIISGFRWFLILHLRHNFRDTHLTLLQLVEAPIFLTILLGIPKSVVNTGQRWLRKQSRDRRSTLEILPEFPIWASKPLLPPLPESYCCWQKISNHRACIRQLAGMACWEVPRKQPSLQKKLGVGKR